MDENISPQNQTPTSPNVPVPPKAPELSSLRTYEGDVQAVLAQKKTSAASIILAENKKKQEQTSSLNQAEEPTQWGMKIVMIIGIFVLIIGGISGAYYLYSKSPLAPTEIAIATPKTSQSLVPTDTHSVILLTSTTTANILSQIDLEIAKPQSAGTIKEIILAQTQGATMVRIPTSDMLKIMKISPPDLLTRSLTPNWMLGEYVDDTGTRSLFVIVTNDFFQNTFAGILQWESSMADDIKQYLGPYISSSSFTIRGKFEDRIIKNKDVREYRTDTGTLLFLYSFIDSPRLIITNNEAVITEIMARLEKQTYVR